MKILKRERAGIAEIFYWKEASGGVNLEAQEISRLVKKNDNDSRHALFEAFYKRTFAIVYNMLRCRENAEDITQDAFIKAFQNLNQLHDTAKFGAWLAVIASNLARNFLKREKRIVLMDEYPEAWVHADHEGTEDAALHNIDIIRIREAIRELPLEQYQVIVLQYYHDLKVDEIAKMLKTNTGTVKSRLFRARQKLASSLEELNSGSGCLISKEGKQE